MIVPIIACLTIVSVVKTEKLLDTLELSQAREVFSWNNTELYLYSELVTWDEANAICEAENMHLTNLDDPAKAKFISQSVSEAWMTYEDMWIGAHRNKNGHWVWTYTNEVLPQIYPVTGNNSFWYPPWINNEIPDREGVNCLAVDRNGHSNPYFVDLSCKLQRSFICENNSRKRNNQPSTIGVMSSGGYEFILYHGRLTWAEAVSFCRQQDSTLATVENMTVVKKLATAMLKSRPELEDAWIGANLQDDLWVWIENGEEIKIIPAEYKVLNGSDNPHNIITPQFPPWFGLENSPTRNKCALLDRHICEHPQFIAMRCDRKRSFICMQRKDDKTEREQLPLQAIDRGKSRYTLYRVKATWEEAKSLCEDIDDSTLLNLTDIEEARFITKIMSDARIPINHIWLSGRIIDNEWYWVGRDEHLEKISIDIDETGFPPWCDATIDESMACLNLDRQNHWTPLIYGLECNTTQSVICVQTIKPKDGAVKYVRSATHNDFTMFKVTKLENISISWMEAERVCRKEIGKLWKPNLEREESKKEVDALFDSFLAEEKRPKVELYHVQGGIYRKRENAWMYNGRTTQIKTAKNPRDGDCLVARINRTAQNWEFLPVPCHRKLRAQIICEPRCSLREVPFEEEKSDWVCESEVSNIFNHKMLGMGCSHRCSDDQVLQGPERFYCGEKRGWIYNQYPSIRVNASKCVHLSDSLNLIADIPEEVSTLVFIIDSTKGNSDYYNAAKYLMGNLVEYYKFQVTNMTVHVVSIESDSKNGDGAVIKVRDFKPTDNCEDINNHVLLPLNDTFYGTTDYASAFFTVESILEKDTFRNSHIVLFAENADEKGNFGTIASRLNRKSKIYAIGLNKEIPNSQLIQLASIVNGVSYSVQFGLPSDAIVAVNGLISNYCPKCVCQDGFHDVASGISFRTGFTETIKLQSSTLSTD